MTANKKTIFFFFPYYHIGGAERVHLRITQCLKDKKNIVFFTDRSRDNKFRPSFLKAAKCYRFFGIQNKINLIEKMKLLCNINTILMILIV